MARPVLILSEHVAMKVRLRDAMAPYARVECVATEHDLLQRIERPVGLIIISDRCRQKVEALRLARQSAPENLHVFLEELLLKDTGDLSVGA